MKWLKVILQVLWAILRDKKPETETEMSIDFDSIKEAAKEALEDAGYQDELDDLLDEYKDLFVDEAKGYLKAIVSTFKGDDYDPKKYAEFITTLDDDQLIAEAGSTADDIAGLVATYNKKRQFVKDLKGSASSVARKALVAGLASFVGPVAGPLSGLLNL